MNRRRGTFACAIAAGVAMLVGAAPCPVAAATAVDIALQRGAQYLLSQQDTKGGSISNKGKSETAMTSLSILALCALGHQPGDPTAEGETLRKALAFILHPDLQAADGYFGHKDNSRMYGHGITTLMLGEMLGMGASAEQDDFIRRKCRRGIELILRAQKVSKEEPSRGGWRYTPDDPHSDMSVTVWQVMALRSAKNAGMDVPKEAIDDAVNYIRRLYDPVERKKWTGGGFGYQNRGHESSTTAEGLLALQVCGQYEAPETIGAAELLFNEGPTKPGDRWFYYTIYYYAQGMYQRGGKYAEEGERVVAQMLLPLQSPEGSWEQGGGDGRDTGKVYATAMAILSLAVKNHFLPIYQR
jgi:hypothetical protein